MIMVSDKNHRAESGVRSRTLVCRKRTPPAFRHDNSSQRSLREFNHLHAAAGLALRMPIHEAGITGARSQDSIKGFIRRAEMFDGKLFDGKNNRLLDSFLFRAGLTAGLFILWSGAGYLVFLLA